MFLALSGRVNIAQGQARLVGKVPLEQAVRADDLKGSPFTFRCQGERLSPSGHQTLTLHLRDQGEDGWARQAEDTTQGGKRGLPFAVLLLEQMFEGVLHLLTVPRLASIRQPAQCGYEHAEKHGNGQERQGRRHL